ncbi:esterase FE4-like [Battus philenor]|uniref:esterase FE4-like n=1 Tax=Battus philenor TaxID=42288 RepID=UPI0035CF178C
MKVSLLSLFVTSAWASMRLDPLVDTKRGLIRGLQASDGDYSMFLGIPYARVNNSNPFGPSLPYPDFEDVFEAYDDSAMCPQIEQFNYQIAGTLDCLHLNIFVPNKATTFNRLPVLVWIYGGRFQYGFGNRYVYGPKYLVRHDVIFITVDYRIGPYGFMCLNTPEVPGNQGLKDQLSALRWIKENIEAFGGDSNKITIVGSSAGAISVDYHLMSTKENLFDKVIMQSGTTQCPFAVTEPDRNAPIKIAHQLGFESDDNGEALHFLSTVDPKLVIGAVSKLPILFRPCVEKEFEGVEILVEKHPLDNDIPRAKNIPILAGINSEELLVLYGNGMHGNHSFDIFNANIKLQFDISEDREMETIVKQFYVGDEVESKELKSQLTDFESDFTFNHPIHRSIRKYLENEGQVYSYVFSYAGGRNMVKWQKNVTEGGAAHSDEKGYLFDVSFLTDTPTEEDQLIIDRITTLWTNFVKYGNPTPDTTDLLPVIWKPVTKDVRYYLDIDLQMDLKRSLYHDRMAFWDLLFQMYGHLLKN